MARLAVPLSAQSRHRLRQRLMHFYHPGADRLPLCRGRCPFAPRPWRDRREADDGAWVVLRFQWRAHAWQPTTLGHSGARCLIRKIGHFIVE